MTRNFDGKLIDVDKFWIDLGVMHGPQKNGMTCHWQSCCLKNFREHYKGNGKRDGYGMQAAEFQWCCTAQLSSQTMQPDFNSDLYRAGHIYSQ